ncbi:alpha/beta hydrolase [Streptomyces dangxiongensis]|uniref:alpha/beta hydrolase n=1 Tax=Streptomyces dangxiongensis TaxID=1442032 RepID=UPI001F08B88A|nr:alpha/beta hydrolase [Streptomyces dangxiongensis]
MTQDTREVVGTQPGRPMRKGPAVTLGALALVGVAGVVPGLPAAEGQGSGDRGEVVSVVPVAAHSRAEIARVLGRQHVGAVPLRYGVLAYRVTYRTVDPQGRPTTATGLLSVPSGGGRRLGLVSDTHGTMANRAYAPSVAEDARTRSYLFAATGRAVAAPDYLGLGEGPGRHPYMDTRSAVTASVDMLRAARTASRLLGRSLDRDLYVTGFSQGGQVAMALARAVQGGDAAGFRLKAVAPVAGPYDLQGTEEPALTDGRVNNVSGVFYLSYFLVAQNRLHPIYKDPAEVFRQPYAGRVEGLFDGRHKDEDIVRQLAPTVRKLLTDRFYRELRKPAGGLLEALRANGHACDWKPDVPVRLYAGNRDTDVPIGNARTCARTLAGRGARVRVLEVGPVGHFGSDRAALAGIARWFSGATA